MAKSARKAAPLEKATSRAVRRAKSKAPATADRVYQVTITLDRSKPPIWRRVLTRDCTLGFLHAIIQVAMGWDDYHLHEFEIRGVRYGDLDQWDDDFGWEVIDEEAVKLSGLAAKRVKKIEYEYDMGDGWKHTIMLEKSLPAERGVRYPRCVEGERACPPEDCGGLMGYYDILRGLKKKRKTGRQKELLDWLGDGYDPDAFDLEAVNDELATLR